jgi:hypothetical protein
MRTGLQTLQCVEPYYPPGSICCSCGVCYPDIPMMCYALRTVGRGFA